jgi:hypothetical protein
VGSSWITNGDKHYDPLADIWLDSQNRPFIKNEFYPEAPIWIDISTPQWNVSFLGRFYTIDWDKFDIPEGMLLPIMEILKNKLKKQSPTYISHINSVFIQFQAIRVKSWKDFGSISTAEMIDIWEALLPGYRSFFRTFYQDMAGKGIGGARPDIAYEMGNWIARSKIVSLRNVREWHPTKGALLSSEEAVLRRCLRTRWHHDESTQDHATRIYGWLLLDTLKRSSQVLEIRADGLKCVPCKGNNEWFVDITPIKYQAGVPSRWWHIHEDLANEIISFNERPDVANFQKIYNRLIVWDSASLYVQCLQTLQSHRGLSPYPTGEGAPFPGPAATGSPCSCTDRTEAAIASGNRFVVVTLRWSAFGKVSLSESFAETNMR